MSEILHPSRFWSRAEVLARPSPVPRGAGIYGWYFKDVPPGVPVDGCVSVRGLTLLYSGIAPKALAASGQASRQSLWNRIRYHYQGNAEGSTLRLTLGCLLSRELGIELRRVGSGRRLTFHGGEATLSSWMAANAFVVWEVDPTPWRRETLLIRSVSLPLNLDQNLHHAYHQQLSDIRRAAGEGARGLPVL